MPKQLFVFFLHKWANSGSPNAAANNYLKSLFNVKISQKFLIENTVQPKMPLKKKTIQK